MANLKEVKGRIQSVTSTQQITKAMKMVAAAKLRKAQDKIMQMRPYAEKLDGVMQNVSSAVDTQFVDNPYGKERERPGSRVCRITRHEGHDYGNTGQDSGEG